MSFTWSDLQFKLPAGSLVVDGDDIKISVKAVTGRSAVAMNGKEIADFCHDWLTACGKAQETYNQNYPTEQIDAFPPPDTAIPTLQADGSYASLFTFTVNTLTSVDFSTTKANPL